VADAGVPRLVSGRPLAAATATARAGAAANATFPGRERAPAAGKARLRGSAVVFNNDLRHPAVLAQELASLDVLSGGRLDVALGAGWNKAEYDQIGLAFDRTAVRQARLADAIAVLKGAFG